MCRRAGRGGVRQRTPLALGALLLSGCYTYTEVQQPAPGSTVRIRVPVQSPLTGRRNAPPPASIEGRLLSAGDTLTMVTRTRHALGPYRELIGIDTVRVSRDALSSLEVQELSTRKTILVSVAITGAITALTLAALSGVWGGGEARPPFIPPQPSVIGGAAIGPAALGSVRIGLPGSGRR